MPLTILAIDPGIGKATCGVAVITDSVPVYATTLDAHVSSHEEIALILRKLYTEYKCTTVVCEDFVFFGFGGGATIAKMRYFIGVIAGFFAAYEIKVHFYTSSVWKKVPLYNGKPGTDGARLLMESKLNFSLSEKKSLSHEIDAYGLGIYHEMVLTNNLPPKIKKPAKKKVSNEVVTS